MKKIFLFISIVSMLTACGDSSKQENQTTDTTPTQNTPTQQPTQEAPEKEVAESVTLGTSFSDFFAKNFVGKSKKGLLNGINASIHEPTGIYMIHTMGANPVIASYQNAAQLQEMLPNLGSILEDINCELSEESLPVLNNEGKFEKKGCFTEGVSGINTLSEKYAEIGDLLMLQYEASELAEAAKADAMISQMVLLTDAGVKMGFAQIEGKWKLIMIDLYSFEMGV